MTALAHLRVHALAHRDGNHGCFAGAGLRLGDDIPALRYGYDGSLLDGRRLLEAELVDAAHQQVLKPHVLEAGHDLDALARLEGKALLCIVLALRRGGRCGGPAPQTGSSGKKITLLRRSNHSSSKTSLVATLLAPCHTHGAQRCSREPVLCAQGVQVLQPAVYLRCSVCATVILHNESGSLCVCNLS